MKQSRPGIGCYAALVSVLMTACTISAAEYTQKEGELQDRGPGLLVKRYYMTLGVVDLGQALERRVQVKALPPEREFILGLRLERGDCTIQASDVRVALIVTDEHGGVVIREDHPLKEFRWSSDRDSCMPAFGYIGGKSQEVRMNEKGDVCMRPIITGADSGRGTYFVSRESAVYDVTVVVHAQGTGQPVSQLATVLLEDNGARDSRTAKCP